MNVLILLSVLFTFVPYIFGQAIKKEARLGSPITEQISDRNSSVELEIVSSNESLSKELLNFLVQGSTWHKFTHSESFDSVESNQTLSPLLISAHHFLWTRGFVNSQISYQRSLRKEKVFLLITVKEGQPLKFLGYQLDPKLPLWIRNVLGGFVGVSAENHADYLAGFDNFDFQMGTLFTTHAGDLPVMGNANPNRYSWFGDADLLGSSSQEYASEYPGFTDMNHRVILSSIRDRVAVNSTFPTPNIVLCLEELNMLAGCLGARKGYPAIKISIHPKVTPEGFFFVVKAENFQKSLTFGTISFQGLNVHGRQEVEEWIKKELPLKNGQVLTTLDLQNIRSMLLESCSFYEVSVRPDRLAGACDLMVTLRDHKDLPQLGDKLSQSQEVLRSFAGFIYNKPSIKISFKYADKRIIFRLDQQESLISIDLTDLILQRTDSITFNQKSVYFHNTEDLLGGVQFQMLWGGCLVVGSDLSPEKEKSRNVFMGVGFSTLDKGMRIASYFTPAVLLFSKSGELFTKSKQLNDGWVFTNEKNKLFLKMNGTQIANAKIEYDSVSELPISEFEILMTGKKIGPSPDHLAEYELLGSEEFPSRFGKLLERAYQKPDTQEGKFIESLLQKFLFPKVSNLLSLNFMSESKYDHTNDDDLSKASPNLTEPKIDESDAAPPDFFSDIRTKLLDSLGWQSGDWPDLLLLSALDLQQKDINSLSLRLGAAFESEDLGPLGNLAYAHLCKVINYHEGVESFYLKTELNNNPQKFLLDLQHLNLTEETFAWIAEMKENHDLKEFLIEQGVKREELENFLKQVSYKPTIANKKNVVVSFINQFYEILIAELINKELMKP